MLLMFFVIEPVVSSRLPLPFVFAAVLVGARVVAIEIIEKYCEPSFQN